MVARCFVRAAAVLACCLASPGWASSPPLPEVVGGHDGAVVGRADADASGGWPVMLWVIDGEHSHVIVRAPREQLGRQPWRPADSRALMDLERFGSPKLTQSMDSHPCPVGASGDSIAQPQWHRDHPGGRSAIAHAVCGAHSCGGAAWRVDLPAQTRQVLPLATLLPGLAASRSEWLVLYVVSPMSSLPLKGVPQLRLADALRGQRSMAQWSQLHMPAEAAARFPAIHTALLEQAAKDQGLVQASVMMRADMLSAGLRSQIADRWDGDQSRRGALGLDGKAEDGRAMVRLLLRLTPGDRPAVLEPHGAPWQAAAEYGDGLKSLQPWPETLASCRGRLAALNCEASCERQVAAMPLPICLQSCLNQKRAAEASLQQRFDAIAERQQRAWRWVEQMTGRTWQKR